MMLQLAVGGTEVFVCRGMGVNVAGTAAGVKVGVLITTLDVGGVELNKASMV